MWPQVQTQPQPAETPAARMWETSSVRVSLLRSGFPPAGQLEVSRRSETSWPNASVDAETSFQASIRTMKM